MIREVTSRLPGSDLWVSQPVMVISAPKIVIVGSGVSGIAAADRLVKAGFQNVRILEATKRSGGRIKTSTLGKCLISIIFHRCLVFKDFFPITSAIRVLISASRFINVDSSGFCWWRDLRFIYRYAAGLPFVSLTCDVLCKCWAWTPSYFGRTWTGRAVSLPDERYCERVHSGVCERHARSVDLGSIRCQISGKNPTKTHRKQTSTRCGKTSSLAAPVASVAPPNASWKQEAAWWRRQQRL